MYSLELYTILMFSCIKNTYYNILQFLYKAEIENGHIYIKHGEQA